MSGHVRRDAALDVRLFAVTSYRSAPRPALQLPPSAARPAAPICRGTIVSIEIDNTALSDKLKRQRQPVGCHGWPDSAPSGGGPARDIRFTMHSPSMSGFSKVGEHVQVYGGEDREVSTVPCPIGTGDIR